MDEVTLVYGAGFLTLRKSESLIAVKPRDSRAFGREEGLWAGPGFRGMTQVGRLGNFSIVRVSDGRRMMESRLDNFRETWQVLAGSHVYHTSDDEVPFVPTGSLMVRFREGVSAEEGQATLARHSLIVSEARDERTLIVVVTHRSVNPLKIAKDLQEEPGVALAEPDLLTPVELLTAPVLLDELAREQWHLKNTGEIRGSSMGLKREADARIVEAWEVLGNLGSRDVVVTILDNGVDLEHSDFRGHDKIFRPWSFDRGDARPEPGLERDDAHGTACAGVAVAEADKAGVMGAAPGCRLMPIQWHDRGELSDGRLEAWFDYARTRGAWIVSCSFKARAAKHELSTRQREAIQRCAQEGREGLGCVVCFGAGNDDRDVAEPDNSYRNPFALLEEVVTVSASTSMDERACYSNFGASIDVCAPSDGCGGHGILTTDRTGGRYDYDRYVYAGYATGDFYRRFGGTSSACALVAGVCGLILSANPKLTAGEVKEILRETAREIDGQDEHSPHFGYGCVHARAAVEEALRRLPL